MAFEQQRAAIAAATDRLAEAAEGAARAAATDRLAEAAEGAARAAAQALLAGVGAEMLKATPDEYGEPFINVTFLGGGPPRDCQGAVWDGAGNERFAGADDACRMLEEAVLTLGFCGRVSYDRPWVVVRLR